MGGIFTDAIRAIFYYLEILINQFIKVFFPDGRPSFYGYLFLVALTITLIDMVFYLFGGDKE